jgi:dolichyl-phosphate-mannose-protein mannosyltransferase
MIAVRRLEVRPRLAIGIIVSTALFLRLSHVFSYAAEPTRDMAVYTDMALHRLTLSNLFSAGGWCRFPPGYALFLKPFLLAMDEDVALRAIQIAQALLGAWLCVLIFRLARRLHSRRAGLVAATLAAFYSHFIFFSSVFMSESLFIPLYVASLLVSLRAAQRPTFRRLFLTGLLAGACVLVRPAGVSLAPALLYAAWRFSAGARRAEADPAYGRTARAGAIVIHPLRARARALLIVAAGGLTLIGPWTIRNGFAYGHPVVVSPEGATNLWIGNHASATGRYVLPPAPYKDPWRLASYYRAQVIEFVMSDPIAALLVTMRSKWIAFWEFSPPWPLSSSNPELFSGDFFPLMCSWRVALALGAVGAGVLVARRRPGAWTTPACLALYVAFHLVFFADTRLRLPAEALFLAWAGVAVAEGARFVPRLRSARAPAWGAAISVLIALVLLQAGVEGARTRRSYATSDALLAAGRGLDVDFTQRSMPLLRDDRIVVDRMRGRYLRVSLWVIRKSQVADPQNLGEIRLTFFDRGGRSVEWTEGSSLSLESLRAGRWVHETFRAQIPTAAVTCSLTMAPRRGHQDSLRIDRPELRYSNGNDLALEFLFPYLRNDE